MTQLLKQAFAEASKLPEIEQNAFAQWMLSEIMAEKKWEKAFEESQDVLEALADEALAEHALGKTKPLEFEKL